MRQRLTTAARTATILLALFALAGAASALAGVINVNTADAETLQLLPRVGPSVASRIVEFRESNGPFRDKEDLLLVRGIGDSTFERLEPFVVLEGESTLSEKVRATAPDQE